MTFSFFNSHVNNTIQLSDLVTDFSLFITFLFFPHGFVLMYKKCIFLCIEYLQNTVTDSYNIKSLKHRSFSKGQGKNKALLIYTVQIMRIHQVTWHIN